ncbi:MAG: trigger factor [Bacteroidota bacterium]
MNIIRENTNDLNAVLKITLEPADYQPKVENALTEYRKKVKLDGFRPGKVPAGLVKKIYGKAIQVDEIQNLLAETLNNYLKENQIQILGEPMANVNTPPIDWESQEVFDFHFDIGISPAVELNISQKDKVNDYKITVTEEMIDKQIEDYTRRFGTFDPTDTVSEEDVVKGDLCQIPEEGHVHHEEEEHDHHEVHAHGTLVYVKTIADKGVLKQFLNAKVNDVLVFNPNVAFPNETDRSALLKVSKEELATINSDFEFTISEISRFTPADVDQKLFDKIYGEGEVDSIESFRNKVKEDIERRYSREARYKFHLDVKAKLMDNTDIPLPEEFLKRWMLATSKDDKLSPEQLDKEFPAFAQDLKWRMIKNHIITETKLATTEEEIREQAVWTAQSRYFQYGIYDAPAEQLFRFADALLKNDEEKQRIADVILENKVIDHVKTLVKLEEKEVSLEEFNKLAN